MNMLDLLRGKTDEGQKVIENLRGKENFQFYWHPGSFRDMRGIEWYLEKEIESIPQFNDPVPFFVATNPNFVTGMEEDGLQEEDYLALKRIYNGGQVKIYKVELDPFLSFRFKIGSFEEDVLRANGLVESRFSEEAAIAYLVEFHFYEEFKYDELKEVDIKTYKLARKAKDLLGIEVKIEGLNLDVKEVKKYYRLCLGCGNYSFINYCLENNLKFDQIHPLNTNVDEQECNSVMRHFFPLLSDVIVVDKDLHSVQGELFNRELSNDEKVYLQEMSKYNPPYINYKLELIDSYERRIPGTNDRENMNKYRIVC